MDLASVVAALASVGVRVSGSTPKSSVQVDSSRACPTGLAGPEPSGTINDPGQHFHGGGASPGGMPSTVVRGAWCQALSLPRPSVLWSGQSGFRVPCVPGAVGAGMGTQQRPRSARPCGPALLSLGVAEGRPWGVPSTAVRGAWCQALSLPRPPVLWSGQPGVRVPFVPGAVGAGVGTQHRPHSVRPCGPALPAVGVAEGCPRGGRRPPL